MRTVKILSFLLPLLAVAVLSAATDPELYYNEAVRYYRQKSAIPALNYINRAISVNSNVAKYYVLRGNILMLKPDREEAKKSFQTALELDPADQELSQYYEKTFRSSTVSQVTDQEPVVEKEKPRTVKKKPAGFKAVPHPLDRSYVGTFGLCYEVNLHESMPGLLVSGEWVRNHLILGVGYSRSIFNPGVDYLRWFSHFHLNAGYRFDLSNMACLELKGGVGVSGYSYYYYPAYVKGQYPVRATLQGFNFYFSPVLRKYFGEAFGMYVSLEYIHTAISTMPVFNATSDTRFVQKNAVTFSVGICFAVEP